MNTLEGQQLRKGDLVEVVGGDQGRIIGFGAFGHPLIKFTNGTVTPLRADKLKLVERRPQPDLPDRSP